MQKMIDDAEDEAADPLSSSSLEEVKIQNRKLRSAISSLTFGFEEEKKRMEAALRDDSGKDGQIADLTAKVQEMDFMLDLVDQKE